MVRARILMVRGLEDVDLRVVHVWVSKLHLPLYADVRTFR